MNSDLLEQLRPIRLPDYTVGLWPLAPGWWILLALLAVAIVGFVLLRPRLKLRRLRQQRQQNTLALLNALLLDCKKEADVAIALQIYLQKSNDIFKRVIHSHPQLAGNSQLSGAAWVTFISTIDPQATLARYYGDNLYARRCHDDVNIDSLHQWALHWVSLAHHSRQEISP